MKLIPIFAIVVLATLFAWTNHRLSERHRNIIQLRWMVERLTEENVKLLRRDTIDFKPVWLIEGSTNVAWLSFDGVTK